MLYQVAAPLLLHRLRVRFSVIARCSILVPQLRLFCLTHCLPMCQYIEVEWRGGTDGRLQVQMSSLEIFIHVTHGGDSC